MQSSASDNYLSAEVQSATPQKLRLLLIETSLRLANRTLQFRSEGCHDRALDALIQAQEIVSQILGSLDHGAGGELVQRVSSVYEFIYRSLVHAGYRRDEKSLHDAIRILEIERRTWRELCDKIAVEAPHEEGLDPARGASMPPIAADEWYSMPGGFSIEA
jgi:flagellar protein FliS